MVHFPSFTPMCSPSDSLVKHDGHAPHEWRDQHKNREGSSVENVPHTGGAHNERREKQTKRARVVRALVAREGRQGGIEAHGEGGGGVF